MANNVQVQEQTAQKHIGETRTMNCGLKATIIAYRHASDIDVQFENKAIRKHMAKINFMRGEIAPTKDRTKTKYIKETRTMRCGLKATDEEIEDKYAEFSESRYAAGWMRLDDELLDEFATWVDHDLNKS